MATGADSHPLVDVTGIRVLSRYVVELPAGENSAPFGCTWPPGQQAPQLVPLDEP